MSWYVLRFVLMFFLAFSLLLLSIGLQTNPIGEIVVIDDTLANGS